MRVESLREAMGNEKLRWKSDDLVMNYRRGGIKYLTLASPDRSPGLERLPSMEAFQASNRIPRLDSDGWVDDRLKILGGNSVLIIPECLRL